MNIWNTTRKLKSMTTTEIGHAIELWDVEIKNYCQVIRNYPPDRMEKYGKPFLEKMETQKGILVDRLRELKGSS